MEYRFNMDFLKSKLDSIDKKLALCKDIEEYNMYAQDHNILTGYLASDISLLPMLSFIDYTKEYSEKIRQKNISNIRKLSSNKDLTDLISKIYLKDISKIPKKKFNLSKITADTAILLAKNSIMLYNPLETKFYDKLINNNGICITENKSQISNGKGLSSSLLTEDISLIYVKEDYNIGDAHTIVHEFAHLMQFENITSLDENVNYFTSAFQESYPLFRQMLFFTSYMDLENGQDFIISRRAFLDTIQTYSYAAINDLNIKYKVYLYSFMLACYFYYLYNTSKEEFNQKLNRFNEIILKLNDNDIIEELNITKKDIDESFEFYVDETKKENKKVFRI